MNQNEKYENSDQIIKSVLKWMQSNEMDLIKRPYQISDLQSGTIFNEILNQIDDNLFQIDSIQETKEQDQIKQNINLILDNLITFYKTIPHLKPFEKAFIDIAQISDPKITENTIQQFIRLTEVVIGAVAYSNKNQKFISSLQDLDNEDQEKITDMIERRQTDDEQLNNNNEESNNYEQEDFDKENQEQQYGMRKNSLMEKLFELENENYKLNKETEDHAQEMKIKQNQINKLLAQLTEKEDAMASLLKSSTENNQGLLMDDDEDNIKENLELQTQISTKQNELINEQWQKRLDQLKSQFEVKINEQSQENKNLQKKVAQIKQLEESYHFYKEKFEDHNRKNELYSEMNKDIQKMRKVLEEKEGQITLLQQKNGIQKDKLEKLKQENINQVIEIQQKNAQIEVSQQDFNDLQERYQLLDDKCLDLQQQARRANSNSMIQDSKVRENKNNQQSLGDEFRNEGINGSSFCFNSMINNKLVGESYLENGTEQQEEEIYKKEIQLLNEKVKELAIENQVLSQRDRASPVKDIDTESKIKNLERNNIILKNEIQGLKTDQQKRKESIILKEKNLEGLSQQESLKYKQELQDVQQNYNSVKQQIQDKNLEFEQVESENARLVEYMTDQQETHEEEMQLLTTTLVELRIKYQNIQNQINTIKNSNSNDNITK